MNVTALDPPQLAIVVTNWDGHAYYLHVPAPHITVDCVALVIAERGHKPYILSGTPSAKPTPPVLPLDFTGEILGAVTIRGGKTYVTAPDVDNRHGYAPPPEVFNAVTDKREPHPDWEYIDEKTPGSAVVRRHYTVPKT